MSRAGVPRGERDGRALVALVQQRAIQTDVLTDYLAISRSHVYETLKSLRTEGLVRPLETHSAGARWAVPTKAGARWVTGRNEPDWTPSPLWCPHGRAVTQTRIALGATGLDAWASERELLTETGGRRMRYPYDGLWTDHASGEVVAVRVDVSNSGSNFRANLAATVARTEHDGCDRLLYVCGGVATPDTVRRHAPSIGGDVPVDAVDLDDLLDHWRQRTTRQATAGDTSTPEQPQPMKPQVTPDTGQDRHRSR